MADELSLGSVLNYQGNAKDALSSGNFMPDLTLSPETQAMLSQFGQQIIDKKKQDFKDWHDNTIKAIASVQDTHDAYSGDISSLNEQSKELIKHIINTPDALTPNALLKNPEGFQDLQSKIGDYAAKVNESRSFNAILKQWDKQTATNTDMNNEVNAKQIEMAKQQPLETRMDYISRLDPVRNGEKEQRQFESIFYSKPSYEAQETSQDPIDKGSKIVQNVGYYNETAYVAGFKDARGDYLSKKWQLDQKLQDQYPLVDDYIIHEALLSFKPKVPIGKATNAKNTEYIENKKDDRQDQMIEFKDKELKEKSRIAFARISSQKTIAEMKSANNVELNSVVDRYQNADKTMAEGATEVDFSGVPALISITTSSNLGTDVERYLNSQKVMVGKTATGAPVFRNANSIARVQIKGTDKIMYAPAYKGDDIESDYEYNTKVILSPKDLMEKMATVKEKSQVQNWYNSHQELSTSQPSQTQQAPTQFKHDNIHGYVDEIKQMGVNIGSVDTGKHNVGSAHYRGMAFDIPQSTNGGVEGLKKLLPKLKAQYPELHIVDETTKPEGQAVWSGAHLHVEMKGAKQVEQKTKPQTKKDSAPKIFKSKKGITFTVEQQ